MKKTFTLVVAILLITGAAFSAEMATDETTEQASNRISYATTISAAIAFPVEAVLNVTEIFKFPVMQFDNPLTKDNNITIKAGAGLSPITLEGSISLAWTPIAFFELYTGASIGSGWSIGNNHGLALNIKNSATTMIGAANFTRAFYSVHFGGALQFDLGAVVPHKWAHILFRIDQFGAYQGVSDTGKYTSWIWQADSGENRNGLRYKAAYLLGYQMPMYLNFIGMRVNTEKTFFAVPDGMDKSLWGEDRLEVAFGPLINFEITKNMTLLLMAQWETQHPYYAVSGEPYYQEKFIDKSKPEKVVFKRVGMLFSYTIKHW